MKLAEIETSIKAAFVQLNYNGRQLEEVAKSPTGVVKPSSRRAVIPKDNRQGCQGVLGCGRVQGHSEPPKEGCVRSTVGSFEHDA